MSQPPFINLLLWRKSRFVSVISWEVGGMRLKEELHTVILPVTVCDGGLAVCLSGYTCNHVIILFIGEGGRKPCWSHFGPCENAVFWRRCFNICDKFCQELIFILICSLQLWSDHTCFGIQPFCCQSQWSIVCYGRGLLKHEHGVFYISITCACPGFWTGLSTV